MPIIGMFNRKIKLGVSGRSQTFAILENALTSSSKTLWYHCASLGEYEQGLPVFKELRTIYPDHKIILTFFSPSGYDIRKNTDIADIVVYLPLDTVGNAKRFLNLVKPELTLFVKYDIWPNYLLELKKRNHRALLISALFRKDQSYFKFYGAFMRKALSAFEHIFVQDVNTQHLLATIDYKATTVTGDTRFDRVYSQLSQNNTLDFIETFKDYKLCLVAGSTWPEDDVLLIDYINRTDKDIKFIIAPHNIKANQIQKLQEYISKKTVLFSKKANKNLEDYSVLIIDTIGLLTKIYSYADIAYVGGAMGSTGLHNTLEPAVFGVPIVIGKHFEKFPEAFQMISEGGMFPIQDKKGLESTLNNLIENEKFSQISGNQNYNFVKKSTGAVIQIIEFIRI
ncbi:3-deoxy-D-manno-octulosonic acid transferase [Bizionia myxarmorum]|uniref:3-deoxy-D-manno-octulosonic acid transferase n=1 Tax=Bizionia myxarmorum TaxID=291186 RepID=A0A5D0RHA8_9FLAO|nr:3-deoxy-D-manno-octulosonic acid transferase [Bizionia myxarmorum]